MSIDGVLYRKKDFSCDCCKLPIDGGYYYKYRGCATEIVVCPWCFRSVFEEKLSVDQSDNGYVAYINILSEKQNASR